MIKPGKHCKWEHISINELFAIKGTGWEIGLKKDCNNYELIADDSIYDLDKDNGFFYVGVNYPIRLFEKEHIYKLPKSAKKLWES